MYTAKFETFLFDQIFQKSVVLIHQISWMQNTNQTKF